MMQKLKELIFGKEPIQVSLPYAFIKYTNEAKKRNIKDDQNKMIEIHKSNKYGFHEVNVEKYHQKRVHQLTQTGIPIIDITKQEQKFTIITKTEPDKIVYTR